MKLKCIAPILLLLGIASFSLAEEKKATILALGDSITAGSNNGASYREILVPEMQKRGLSFEFIGPNRDDTSRHAGFGGRNTASLRKMIEGIYKEYPADIVLLHSGHNSFSHNKPVKGIVADTALIVEKIHAIRSDATVVIAQVIPAGKLPKYDYIPQLNRELAALHNRFKAEEQKVVLVDMATGFNWRTDASPKDLVHPNLLGATKMANKWLAALLPLLEQYSANKTPK